MSAPVEIAGTQTPAIVARSVPPLAPRAHWPAAIALSLGLGAYLVPVALATGSRYWIALCVAAPASAIAVLLYLSLARRRARDAGTFDGAADRPDLGQVVVAAVVLALATLYVLTSPISVFRDYLAWLYLASFSGLVVGAVLLSPASDPRDRFAAMRKMVEALVACIMIWFVAYVAACIEVPVVSRVTFHTAFARPAMLASYGLVMGFGPVLAVAAVYDAGRRPAAQRFDGSFSRALRSVSRWLLLPVAAVLLLALALSFGASGFGTDAAWWWNFALIGVLVLLVSATPLEVTELPPRAVSRVRFGIITLALTAVAMEARLVLDTAGHWPRWWTNAPSIVSELGFGLVATVALALLVLRLARHRGDAWPDACHRAFATGLALQMIWCVLALALMPRLDHFVPR